MNTTRLPVLALTLLAISLPLATAPLEITTGLALFACIIGRRIAPNPWLLPALLWVGAWLIAALPHGTAVAIQALGFGWALIALVIVPPLAARVDREFIVRRGLEAAAVVGLIALGQRLLSGDPASGGFSHHLTLAYALIPPLAVACAKGRWLETTAIAAGILATGSEGAVIPMAVAIIASRSGRPVATAAVGATLLVGALLLAHGDVQVGERAVLWTGSAEVVFEHPEGTGPTRFEPLAQIAFERLQPGMWFPYHAHDAALQQAGVAGIAGLIAMVWMGVCVFRQGHPAAVAGIAALAVAGLTQDVWGDLEVLRSGTFWLALLSSEVITPAKEP
jgi:hypothetical protein